MSVYKIPVNTRATSQPQPYHPRETQLPRPPKPSRHLTPRMISIIASVVIVVLAVSTIATVVALSPKDVDALVVQPQHDPGVAHENIVLVGSDTRAGATMDDNVGTETDVSGDRADTIMLASIPASHDSATLVSLPRDTLVTPARECNMDDSHHKINELYSVGDNRTCFIATLENVFQTRVTRYVSVSMPQLKHIVDTVGGVTLCFSEPMSDSVLGTISPQSGEYHMNGRQSLKFVRARHIINGDGRSDLARVEHQRLFLTALVTKISHLSPGKKADVAAHILSHTETDGLSMTDIRQFMTLASTLNHKNIKRLTFPTVASQEIPGALDIDESRVGELLASLSTTLHDTTHAQRSPSMVTALTYHPQDVTIVLRYHPSQEHRAKQLDRKLSAHGFTVTHEMTTSLSSSATVGFFSPGRYRELVTVMPVVPDITWTYMDESDDNYDTFALVIVVGGSVRVSQPLAYKTSMKVPENHVPLSMKDIVMAPLSHEVVADDTPQRVTLCT